MKSDDVQQPVHSPHGTSRPCDLLIEVDGLGEVDDVTQRIFAALDVIPES